MKIFNHKNVATIPYVYTLMFFVIECNSNLKIISNTINLD